MCSGQKLQTIHNVPLYGWIKEYTNNNHRYSKKVYQETETIASDCKILIMDKIRKSLLK